MIISIPEMSLVVLVGPSGSGKSTFAKAHFRPTEILSSDWCRGLVSDDENDQSCSKDAFDVLGYIAGKRLAAGRLTVVDATNVQPEDRKPWIDLAREHDLFVVAIVLNMPEKVCHERNRNRPGRDFGPQVVRSQCRKLRQSFSGLRDEGFRYIYEVQSPEQLEQVTVDRPRLWTNRRDDHGPFDIIGDVHGCFDELVALLELLGYSVEPTPGREWGYHVSHPEGRRVIFLGDLVDRGPGVVSVLGLVMSMVEGGSALCVPGNHDNKLQRWLRGRDVQQTHGLAETISQFESTTAEFREQATKFLQGLVSHYVLDRGRLVVAHAGLKEAYQGRSSARVRTFALFGETTDEVDKQGLPVRGEWASQYRGGAAVVYGHTPIAEPRWLNRTVNIDTGCVFGGKLTALRWPEKELLSVPAARAYYPPSTERLRALELASRPERLSDTDRDVPRPPSTTMDPGDL